MNDFLPPGSRVFIDGEEFTEVDEIRYDERVECSDKIQFFDNDGDLSIEVDAHTGEVTFAGHLDPRGASLAFWRAVHDVRGEEEDSIVVLHEVLSRALGLEEVAVTSQELSDRAEGLRAERDTLLSALKEGLRQRDELSEENRACRAQIDGMRRLIAEIRGATRRFDPAWRKGAAE